MNGYREYLRIVFLAGLVLAWLIAGALQARAHTVDQIEAWLDAWIVEADVGLNGRMIEDYRDFRDRHIWYFVDTTTTKKKRARRPSVPRSVESWRPLVASHFDPGEVDRALCLLSYESAGDPNATNPSSGAAGLFQHLPRYWPERSQKAGWAGASIYDPEANVAVAAWLQDVGGWTHWSPYNRGLCR